MTAYNPTLLQRHTRAKAEEVNAELLKIQAAFLELQTAFEALQSGETEIITLYTWRAYSNAPDGSIDFTTGAPNNHSYIGFAFNRLLATPSQIPADYEWSPIQGTVGNFIAIDTINVAGRPSGDVIDDLALLANQLLAYQFDRQYLRDYVDARLYVAGEPVNTVIIQESNERIAGDTALAETISLIGAKNLTGSAFILDLDKVYVDSVLSLAVRLSTIQAIGDNAQASVNDLEQAIVTADYATASDMSLLGAKNLAGDAWIMNLNTVKVSPSETFANYINTAVAAAAGGAASVTEIYEAVITPEGGASAKAVLQLDVNGKVVGYAATNSNNVGAIIFTFDSFVIQTPDGNAMFTAAAGVVSMPNVIVEKIKINSIDTESLKLFSIRRSYATELVAAVPLPYGNSTAVVASLTINKELADSEVEIAFYMRMRPGQAYAGTFNLYRTIAGNKVFIDQVWYWLDSVVIGGLRSVRTTEPYQRRFSGVPAGNVTYSLELAHWGDNGVVSGSNIQAGSGFFVEEIKR